MRSKMRVMRNLSSRKACSPSSYCKMPRCGKEFIHEKDRLHHVREEHEKKIDHRTHKWEHVYDQKINPQEQVD